MLNSHQKSEMNYWGYHISNKGEGGFKKYRSKGYDHRTQHFPELRKEEGLGLDYGCGCISVFEWSDKKVHAVDPLIDEYQKLVGFNNTNNVVAYHATKTEEVPFDDETFDWILNYNVIDHTPDPQAMADEMYRVLKKGGRVYFQVNFDKELSNSHYELWNKKKLNKIMKKFTKKFSLEVETDERTLYFATYVK